MPPRSRCAFLEVHWFGAAFCLLLCGLPYVLLGAQDWRTNAACRWFPVPTTAQGHIGFTLMDPVSSGLAFTNLLSPSRSLTNQIHLNGSGVACGDVNGDGWCDIILAGLDTPNSLFLNQGGWRFIRSTGSGLELPDRDCTGVLLADLDGDADFDAVINTIGSGTILLFNDGTGHFLTRSESPLLNSGRGGMSTAVADFDQDGDLDLYLANYRTTTFRDLPNTRYTYGYDENRQPVLRSVNGVPVTDPSLQGRFTSTVTSDGRLERVENGEPDLLCLNDGHGIFTPVSWTNGTFLTEEGVALDAPPYDWGLSVVATDFNGDGQMDIYVCNDFPAPDRTWINQTTPGGPLRFRAAPRLMFRHTSYFSMGSDVADLNRDGWDDLFVVEMRSRDHRRRMVDLGIPRPESPPIGAIDNRPQVNQNVLQLNRGDGTFAEVADFAGLDASEWSWTPVFLDVDLDGWEDVLVTAGHERDTQHLDLVGKAEASSGRDQQSFLNARKALPRFARKNLAFRNRRDLTFEEAGRPWGFDAEGVSHGLALADLDNDGDLDAVVNRLNDPALLYRNEATAPRILVRLRGRTSNRHGIGARIVVEGGPVAQSQTLLAGGRYLSSDEPARMFAAGDHPLRVAVRWPDGEETLVTNLPPNAVCEVFQAAESAAPVARLTTSTAPTWFVDVSQRLNHVHWEDYFDDFSREPLLPHKLSQAGPGIAWADLDGDRRDDLVITAGRGGRLTAYRNTADQGFQLMRGSSQPVADVDYLGVVTIPTTNGMSSVLVSGSRWQAGGTNTAVIRAWMPPGGVPADVLACRQENAGSLALADFEGDGNLTLFAGGSAVPGRYPLASASALYRRQPNGWTLDELSSANLRGAGLVGGACFADLTGDGRPELVLACEWGPVRVFEHQNGGLREITVERGLSELTGLWSGVASGDFDEDGQTDLVVANGGLNREFVPTPGRPRRAFWGELGGEGGTTPFVQARHDRTLDGWVPLLPLDALAAGWPRVRERFTDHASYGAAQMPNLLGSERARSVEAATFASVLLLNRGDRFEVHPLPFEAQITAASAVLVEDFNGDGHEDVFLGQNFFPVRPEDTRLDAGRGLLLWGDGGGRLTAVAGQSSGLLVYGDQRGAAAADFDGDGRVDLAVTQNGGPTKLYRNVQAQPGLRVRLAGPAGNPSSIGGAVRASQGQKARPGPWREIQAGSGYLSQNSPVQVIATMAQLDARWPDGATRSFDIPAGAREVTLHSDGRVEVTP